MDRPKRKLFHLVLIKPSHYDDDGYVIQWARSVLPSNTLATLYGLALDCVEKRVLGEDVDIALTAYDETNTRTQRPPKHRGHARALPACGSDRAYPRQDQQLRCGTRLPVPV